jgi:dihydropteroate synthase
MCFNGVIIIDDDGVSTCPGATKAVDEFNDDRFDKVLIKEIGYRILIKKENSND